MESDDAGLQPQTSVEPGELREIDVHPSQNCFGGQASGGGKSPAKSLNRGGTPFFPFVGEVIVPGGYLHEPNLWKIKTGDLNFRAAGQTFSPPITRPALEFSHSLAPLLGLVLADSHSLDGFGNKLSSCATIQPLPMISAPLPQYLDIDRNFYWADAWLTLQLLKGLLSRSAPLFVRQI